MSELIIETRKLGNGTTIAQINGKVFTMLARSLPSIIPRLIHRCHILELGGESYRFRQNLQCWTTSTMTVETPKSGGWSRPSDQCPVVCPDKWRVEKQPAESSV